MAATSGHVPVVIADRCRVQYWRRRANSEARKNRFLFRILTRVAFHSGPSDRRQQAGVSIDYCLGSLDLFTCSITKR